MILFNLITFVAVVGGVLGILSTALPWIFKARESDISLKQTLDSMNATVGFNNQLLNRDIEYLRREILELRQQIKDSATRQGHRISLTKTLLLKLINHLNNKKGAEFAFVDLKELDD